MASLGIRGAHLNCIDRVHDRVFLFRFSVTGIHERAASICAYRYARKRARSHVLEQRKIGRQSFIAIDKDVSDRAAYSTTCFPPEITKIHTHTHAPRRVAHPGGPFGRPRPQMLLRTSSMADPGWRPVSITVEADLGYPRALSDILGMVSHRRQWRFGACCRVRMESRP